MSTITQAVDRPRQNAFPIATPQMLYFGFAATCCLVSAGTRLDIPVAAWIGPVLLLRFARTSALWPAIVGVILASSLQMASWVLQTAAPFTLVTPLICLAVGTLFAIPIVLDRAIGSRLSARIRLFLLPAATAMIECLAAGLLPLGASIGTKVNTQSEWLTLVQIISLFGPYSIGFLVAFAATTVNAIWEQPDRRTTVAYGGVLGGVMLAVILFGVICFDADWPSLSRIDADIMLLPGWDWPEEGYIHTMKVARLRSIENGYSLIRADYDGLTAALDPYGRVLAAKDTLAGQGYTTVVDLPVRGMSTLYGWTGDVFAWLCGALTLIFCGLAFIRPVDDRTGAVR